MPSGIEWVILLVVLVVLFGANRLPEMARAAGRSARVLRGELKGTAADHRPDGPASPAPADHGGEGPARPAAADHGGEGPARPTPGSPNDSGHPERG